MVYMAPHPAVGNVAENVGTSPSTSICATSNTDVPAGLFSRMLAVLSRFVKKGLTFKPRIYFYIVYC